MNVIDLAERRELITIQEIIDKDEFTELDLVPLVRLYFGKRPDLVEALELNDWPKTAGMLGVIAGELCVSYYLQIREERRKVESLAAKKKKLLSDLAHRFQVELLLWCYISQP